MLTFVWWPIWLLLPLPLLVRVLLPRYQSNQHAYALRVPFYQRLATLLKPSVLHNKTQQPSWLLLMSLLWLLLLASASRPVWLGEPIELPATGRDLMLVVDLSQSMETPDFEWQGEQVNRLVAVKKVVGDFITRRQQDRIGLVLFGSQAYLQTPLTFDHVTLKRLLDEAQIGMAGPQTAIGDGIALALKRLRAHASASRVLILLTDGANTAGAVDPIKAAELAAQEKLKIYTIGVGADRLTVSGPFGMGRREINPSADLDEDALKKIAQLTDGQYFRAKDLDELQKIYALLDKLEPIEVDHATIRPQRDYFHWPLTAALLVSLLLLALSRRTATLE
jgi:Ca-activated chloride channel family protein